MDSGQEDMCDTGLVLGLSCSGSSGLPADRHHQRGPRPKLEPLASNSAALEPSLTLGLPSNTYGLAAPTVEASKRCAAAEERAAHEQSPRQSTVSSFSNTMKRENDAARSDEGERVSSRVSDEEEEGSVRKKLRLTKEQSALLEDRFKEQSTLNPKQKINLARQLNLRPRQVEVWFQNRRARTKLKQTEVDCEYLKRCCESLTDENRRLQKELQELKAIKFAATPLFMQLPGAAFTMCPSCEKITPATDGSKSSSPFMPKPHFYNPFTHSAAC